MHSFNGGLEFKDALDLDAYDACTATEKRELDGILESKLADGDPRVAHAIAAMWPKEKATALLTHALAGSSDEARDGIARALRVAAEAVG